ncbi:MAG TPA: alpha/beta fold hydrolase [Myxococcota bacterium]|nr:alpha/beta fold hydrolase [Myxococcota bacterium]
MELRDLLLRASDGTPLGGWLASPPGGPHPLIVMTHGLSALIDLGLSDYAEQFTAAGFACLAYDHRNWGRSAGWPRHESDPWQQVEDLRDAISFARTLPSVDPARIGLWGTSYSGGHVLTVAALDSRVRCVVSQVPFVSGRRNFDVWVPANERAATLAFLAADRDGRARGEPPATRAVAFPGSEADEWARRVDVRGIYPNQLTFRSLDLVRTYEPGSFADAIAAPLLMIVADRDTTNPVEWQLEAFARAPEPKRLVRLPCRHYDVYLDSLKAAASAATDWFARHLLESTEA